MYSFGWELYIVCDEDIVGAEGGMPVMKVFIYGGYV